MRPATLAFTLGCVVSAAALAGFLVPLPGFYKDAGAAAAHMGLTALGMCVTWLDSQNGLAYAGICFLLSLLAAGLLNGAVSALVQCSATARFVEALRLLRSQRPVRGADVVDSPDVFALCHGLCSPQVVLSRGLVELLTPEELDAVLIHERHHQAHHDPLKTLLARTLAAVFFFVPVVPELMDRYLQLKELDADRAAMRGQPDDLAMASAFCKVARSSRRVPIPADSAIGALLSPSAERVAQLSDGRRAPWRPSTAAVVVSFAVLTFQSVIGLISLTGVDAMPMTAMPTAAPPGLYARGELRTLLCCALMVGVVGLLGRRAMAVSRR
jgi:hypothetical protein